MEYAQIVFYQLVIFVIYGAIGVAAVKGGILDEAGLHAVSRVVIKVTLPVMLFTNTVSGVTRESLLESLPVTGATAVMYLLLALLCWGMSRAFGLRGDKASVFMASTMFGNVGFIGIPIIAMLFPERGNAVHCGIYHCGSAAHVDPGHHTAHPGLKNGAVWHRHRICGGW